MNKRYHILSFIAALMTIVIQVNAQYADIVCAGSTRVYKTTGNTGSTFHWTIDGGGTISNPVGDSIEVLWGDKAGEYHIQVVQTTIYGCKGAPVVATIRLSTPPKVELGTDVKMCSGQTVTLDAGDGFTS